MGVGTPIDLLESVHRGVDMFDCIIPSQLAQRGVVFTSRRKDSTAPSRAQAGGRTNLLNVDHVRVPDRHP